MERLARPAVAFAIGVIAAGATRSLGMPGSGLWIPVVWALGVLVAITLPSVASLLAAVLGISLSVTVNVAVGGQYAGLAWLVAAAEAAVLGHGFLVGVTAVRAWRLRSLRDGRVLLGGLAALLLAGAYVLIASDFARNPP